MKHPLLLAALLLALTACAGEHAAQSAYRNDTFGISAEPGTVESVNIIPVDGAKYGLPPLPQPAPAETKNTQTTQTTDARGVVTTSTRTTTRTERAVYIKGYHYVVRTDGGQTRNIMQDYSENLIPFAKGDRVQVQSKGVYEYTLLPLK